MQKLYTFKVLICGYGDTPEEAWDRAVEQFSMEPGPTPDEGDYEITEEEDQ